MPHVLLTRPDHDSQAFSQNLQNAGLKSQDILVAPVFRIDPVPDWTTPALDNTLIFTSRHGVMHAASKIGGMQFSAICVGQQTTRCANEYGFKARFGGETVDDFVDRFDGDLSQMTHLRGAHTTGNLANRLSKMGQIVDQTVIYEQNTCPWSAKAVDIIKGGTPMVVPLFSQRSATLVCERLDDWSTHSFVAISPAVGEICKSFGCKTISIAQLPTADAMCDLTMQVVHRLLG